MITLGSWFRANGLADAEGGCAMARRAVSLGRPPSIPRPTVYVWPATRPAANRRVGATSTEYSLMIASRLSRTALPDRPFSRVKPAWVVLLITALALTACAEPRPQVSRERVFAADLSGASRRCEAPIPAVTDGQTVQTTMRVGADGGWCGLELQRGGRPYDSALLTGRPTKGRVVAHRVGDVTRLTYTPNQGFTGTDSFAVKLIPGDATVRVAVTVAN